MHVFLLSQFPHGVKIDTDEIRRLSIDTLYSKFCVAENADMTILVCQGEHVNIIVLGNIVHLKLKQYLCYGIVNHSINKDCNIIFDAYSYGLPNGTPADINALFKV